MIWWSLRSALARFKRVLAVGVKFDKDGCSFALTRWRAHEISEKIRISCAVAFSVNQPELRITLVY